MRPHVASVLVATLVAALSAACQPGAPVGAGKPSARAPKAPGVTPPKGGTLFPPLTAGGGGIVANNGGAVTTRGEAPPVGASPPAIAPGGGGIVANNGAALTGTVKAPPGLIGNNGAGLISDRGGGLIGNHSAGIVANNGAGVVANNGGTYRLAAAPAQGPVANVRVGLVDATGALQTDPAGQPYLTVTGPDGAYAFAAPPTDRPLFVLVDLPEGRGQLAAVAPAASGPRAVDLDLVSTLTTGYIYNQYVAWQPDPGAVLAKLPAAVEATTRAKAAQALAASEVALPARLGPDEVAGTVARLRTADLGFDAQLEEVKRLLVFAGQADLGNGQPATGVFLPPMTAMGAGPDGRLYMQSIIQQRIWRLTPEGRLEAVAGFGALDRGSLTGKRAVDAGLGQMWGFGFDAIGRLLLAENGNVQRLSRVEPDGRLTELLRPPGGRVDAAWPQDDGRLLVLSAGQLLDVPAAGGAATLRHAFPAAEAAALALVTAYGRDAAGRLLVTAAGPVTYRIDPAAPALQPVKALYELVREPILDMNGRLFDVDPASLALTMIAPDGARQALGTLPEPLYQHAVTIGADGAVYLGSFYKVLRLADGALTPVAGLDPTAVPATGALAALPLMAPTGLLPEPGGATLLADRGAHRIWRLKADGTYAAFAGTGAPFASGDGGPALAAGIQEPGELARDAAGNVYVVTPAYTNGNAIRRIAPDGTISTLVAAPADQNFAGLAALADGTLFTGLGDAVLKLPPGSTQATVLHTQASPPTGPDTIYAFARDAAGGIHWAHGGKLLRWTEAAGVVALAPKVALERAARGGLLLDAAGRYYMAPLGQSALVRYDPAGDTLTKIAGVGAPLLTGARADDTLRHPAGLAFDAGGALLIADEGNAQIKRLEADRLPP